MRKRRQSMPAAWPPSPISLAKSAPHPKRKRSSFPGAANPGPRRCDKSRRPTSDAVSPIHHPEGRRNRCLRIRAARGFGREERRWPRPDSPLDPRDQFYAGSTRESEYNVAARPYSQRRATWRSEGRLLKSRQRPRSARLRALLPSVKKQRKKPR